MKHPFHAIITDSEGKHFFGALSDRVQKYSLTSGQLLAEYILPGGPSTDSKQKESVTSPPRKKTKTEDDVEVNEEKVTGGNRQEGVRAIRQISLSRDEKYLIGTESKSVHILNADDLSIYSQRTFPKRPSSVATSVGDKDLIVGDKFGDAYSVPFLSKEPLILASSEAAKESKSTSIEPILGHVSMLVDLTIGEADNKQYVITADRDEHIRVSKFPESYVVERWLFGHTEFVSALLVLPWSNQTLVSGGGDDFVAIWNWTTGELYQKLDVRSLIASHLTEEFHTALRRGSYLEISVASIVPLPEFKQVAILFEATNTIIILQVNDSATSLQYLYTLPPLTTRIIDITTTGDGKTLIASLDGPELLKGYTASASGKLEPLENLAFAQINENGSVEREDGDSGFPLYSMKHLRKRGEF